jgi:hypothetical protein
VHVLRELVETVFAVARREAFDHGGHFAVARREAFDHGGHFPARERTAILADSVRRFSRS